MQVVQQPPRALGLLFCSSDAGSGGSLLLFVDRMLGLALIFVFVLFFLHRRDEKVEDEMITKVKDRMKLTGSDPPTKPPWEREV